MPLRLKFGTAKHGWLPAVLEIDACPHVFSISYLPRDFLRDLVDALSRAASYEGPYTATICEEPTESDWTFRRIQDCVVFSVIEHPGHQRTKGIGKKIVETSGSVGEILLPVWRGLRELESRRLKEHFKAHWSNAFPVTELERLTDQLERFKDQQE